MITVMGANGHTGRVVADALLRAGHKVRVLGRSKEKLMPLAHRGAEVRTGDAADATFLTHAFEGSEAVYTLIPSNLQAEDLPADQDHIGEAIATAVRNSGTRRVVLLSSVGADHSSGTGPIAGLHRQEQRLKALPEVEVLALRAGYFMENMAANLPMIEQQGINGGAIAGDVRFAAVATRDIGEVAAQALISSDFHGFTVREILGPKDVTMNELTHILGEKMGKPDLRYVHFPYDDFAAALQQAGLSASVAQQYAEMARAFNEGKIVPAEPRTPQSSTPTSFEIFANQLLAVPATA